MSTGDVSAPVALVVDVFPSEVLLGSERIVGAASKGQVFDAVRSTLRKGLLMMDF